jgi:hypothetical protein
LLFASFTFTEGVNIVHYQNLMIDVIEVVLGWDLPDVAIADAVRAQAGLVAGTGAD